MAIWAVLLGGPLVLPLALLLRSDLPLLLAEALLVVGVLGLFLSICATEAVGSGSTGPQVGTE